jgi:NodT family efflux transporter outer membrane factor (OMF) lipoprotein
MSPGAPPVPAAFRATSASAAAAWPTTDWWRGFGSAELDRLMTEAKANNLDIAAAAARVVQADAQARVAGAGLLPSVDLSAGASRSRQSSSGLSSGSRPPDRNALNVGLAASYEIDFWGKNRAALESARSSALASRFDQETVALGILASTADTYFQIIVLQARLEIARENLAIALRVLKAIQARISVGTATALDRAQQESVVATERVAIPPLQEQLAQTRNALAILLGRLPEDLSVEGGDPAAIRIPVVGPGLPSELLTRRPDVRLAEAQLQAADADVRVARAAMFPSITLTAQGGLESDALKSLFDPASQLYSIAAGLTQPIFEGFSLEGQLEAQRGRYVELLQDYRKAVLSSFEDVENALVAVRQTTLQEKLQADAVVVARRAYTISEAQLRAGTVDLLTVLDTQQSLFQANDALAQARQARLQAYVGLFQALGGGWTTPAPTTTGHGR